MVIEYRKYESELKNVSYLNSYGEKVTIFNVPVKVKGRDRKLPDSFKQLELYIEEHCIKSLDWQDWLFILKKEDEEEWQKNQEWYDALVDGYKNMSDKI